MTPSDETWDRLIEKLTSGESVDWDVELIRYPDDTDYIEKLKALEQIYIVLNSGSGTATEKIVSTSNSNSKKLGQFTWGHLQVIEPIGEGNFGEVFRAFDPLLNRDVALKLLKVEQMSVIKSRHFIAEARSLAKVRNRHVLAIHGANMHDGRVGFWADLLSGDTLADTAVDYTSQQQLLKVAEAVTDALGAVHQAGLIHGDVKLSNVMSQEDGKITLMDFGAGGEIDMAATNTGSPILMAPELFNEQAKTAASDIYALGVMLFKLATDQYPIKADNVLEVMQAHKDQAYKSLKTLRSDLNNSVRQMIDKMLLIDPHLRPDIAAIKYTLNEIKTAPQRRTKRLMIAGLYSVLVLATLVSSWGFFQANQARIKAETEQQKATAVSEFLQQMLESPRNFGEGQELKVVKLLDFSADNAVKNFTEQPAVLAIIESALGQSYSALAMYEKALLHIEKALLLNTELYGLDNQATLVVMHSKAYVLYFLSEYQQSQAVAEKIIELTAANAAVDRANFTAAYHRLAAIANSQDDYEKALTFLNHKRVNVLEPDKAQNNQSAFNLTAKSNSYFGLGDYIKAEEYANLALAWNLAWFNAERNQHRVINLIPFRNQLANTLNIQGKSAEAEDQYRLALAQAESYYGKEQVGYLAPLANLGISLYEQGKFQQALEIGRKVQEINQKFNGRINSNSIKAGIGVSNALVGLGRLEEGEQVMRSSLDDAVELDGAESMDALMLEYNLAELLIKQGKYQNAVDLSHQNHQRMQSVLGEQHPFTPLALSNLATALTGQQKYQEAQVAHNNAVMGVKSIVGDQQPFYFVVIWNRLQHYHQLDQKDPGIDDLKQLLKSQSDVLGAEHVDTLRSQKLLEEWQLTQ